MICKICNTPIPEQAVFCPVCGTETGRAAVNKPETKKCLQCGAKNPLNAKFCRVDGWSFPSEVIEAKPETRQAGEEEIQCPKCGTLNPATARFCRKDGSLLKPNNATDIKIAEKKSDTQVDSKTPAKTPEENVRGSRNNRLWISLAVLLVFSFAGAYWFFSGPATNKKSQPIKSDTEEVRPAEQTPRQNNEPVKKKNGPQPALKTETKEKEHEKIDLPRLEGQINRALRKEGLDGVTAEVDDSAVVTLKGVVKNLRDKKKAFETAKSFSGVRQVKDIIFVIER